jgi:quinolinate synthase
MTGSNNKTKSKMISDTHELHRFHATPAIEVMNLLFASDGIVRAGCRFIAETISSLRYTNEVIGSYVAAGCRMRLYSYLDRLQKLAIYCDTDSVFYIQERTNPAAAV